MRTSNFWAEAQSRMKVLTFGDLDLKMLLNNADVTENHSVISYIHFGFNNLELYIFSDQNVATYFYTNRD